MAHLFGTAVPRASPALEEHSVPAIKENHADDFRIHDSELTFLIGVSARWLRVVPAVSANVFVRATFRREIRPK